MKYICCIMVCLFLFSISYSQSSYQWVQKRSGSSLGGPIDYDINNPNIVYYGSDNIIYKSTDMGETFAITGITVPGATEIKSIHVDYKNPGTFVVAIESSPNDKIYKTANDGASWTLTNNEGQMSFFGIPVTRDPSNPTHLYTMIGINFKKSTDFGSNWTTIASNFGPNSAPCDIEVFPDTSIILIGDNGTGIFKSTNYGVTWTQKYVTSGEIPTISVDFINPGVAWATKWGGGGGFLKSTDYGETWVAQSTFTSINMWGVHVQPTDGNIILVNSYSTAPGSWRSTNGGVSWLPISIPSTGYQVVSVDSMNQFAAQGNGFYKLESPFFSPMQLSSLTVLVEGLYNGVSMTPDTVTVQLRGTSLPYSVIDQAKILLDNNGHGSANFFTAANGIPYYLVVKHRNGLETWSASPQSFSSNALSYDFTSASNKAYGNNLKLIGSKWCIYSGDVNQDGFINSSDVNSVYTSNVIGITGYNATDLTGDSFTEIADLNIVYTNSASGIQVNRPPGATLNDNTNE